VNPSVPAKSLGELITLAKKTPGALSYAPTDSVGTSHLSAELLKMRTGTEMVHIPYKAEERQSPDLISGQVPKLLLTKGEPSLTFDEGMQTWDYIIEHFSARCLGGKVEPPVIL
jgi:tripartite-type tricarboxylate transporter receptor subunit TctC